MEKIKIENIEKWLSAKKERVFITRDSRSQVVFLVLQLFDDICELYLLGSYPHSTKRGCSTLSSD